LGIVNMRVVIVEFDMIKLFNFLLPFLITFVRSYNFFHNSFFLHSLPNYLIPQWPWKLKKDSLATNSTISFISSIVQQYPWKCMYIEKLST
jgi:hypothetical protein